MPSVVCIRIRSVSLSRSQRVDGHDRIGWLRQSSLNVALTSLREENPCPIDSPTKQVPICCSTRTTRSTGIPGATEALAQARDGGQADAAQHRLLGLPLVPRHGARVVRGSRRSPTLMNERFVNIKVDREERPDVDSIYMAAVQAMTGQRRLAAERVPHARRHAVLRRHLFSAAMTGTGMPGVPAGARGGRRRVARTSATKLDSTAEQLREHLRSDQRSAPKPAAR